MLRLRPSLPTALIALSLGVLVGACTADAANSETPTPSLEPPVEPGRSVEFDLICSGSISNTNFLQVPALIILPTNQQVGQFFCIDEPMGSLNDIDFDTSYGVGVIRGWFPSGLYTIEVRDVLVSEDTVTTVVAITDPPEFPPPPGEITVPYQLIAIDKAAIDGTSVWQMVATDGTVLTMTRFPPEWRR